jgi:hypothetical protein
MMFGNLDYAGIEAVLGVGVRWVDDEDASDVTYLMDKSIREGLTEGEQSELDALVALFESGR